MTPSKKWPPIIKCVIKTIDRYEMFAQGERVLVGVSGGPDSTALLHILNTLAPCYDLKLAVAHLNHGLRPGAADQDAAFVRQLARTLNLPIFMDHAAIQTRTGSLEEQARVARYAFFKALMDRHGYTKIALGHHKNDNAEAVLMHLLRGSGIRGLAGIPPVRNHGVVRPMIHLARSEILDYLAKHQISFREDATNNDSAYQRNRIRHHLIPLLESSYNPNIVDILHRTADLCRVEETWLNRQLKPLLDAAVASVGENRLELHIHVLKREHPAVQRRLIRGALNRWRGHLRRLSAYHVERLIELLDQSAVGKRANLPYKIEAKRGETLLILTPGSRSDALHPEDGDDFSYCIASVHQIPGTIDLPHSNLCLIFKKCSLSEHDEMALNRSDQAWFDLDRLEFPLVIRHFRPGDRIHPYGMQGSQKVKKLFIDRKIHQTQRRKIPIVAAGDAIIWVAGIRRSSHALVSKDTTRILTIRTAAPVSLKTR